MFTYFPKLPAELRHLIWTFCLPEPLPRVFMHKRDSWRVRWRLPGELWYNAILPDDNAVYEYDQDMMDSVQIPTPLLDINKEARDFALRWARKENYLVNISKADSPFRIVLSCRPLPERDILYISMDDMEDFMKETIDSPAHPLIHPYGVWVENLHFSCVAVHMEVWQAETLAYALAEAMIHMTMTKMILLRGDISDIETYLEGFPQIRSSWTLRNRPSKAPIGVLNGDLYPDYRKEVEAFWSKIGLVLPEMEFDDCIKEET